MRLQRQDDWPHGTFRISVLQGVGHDFIHDQGNWDRPFRLQLKGLYLNPKQIAEFRVRGKVGA